MGESSAESGDINSLGMIVDASESTEESPLVKKNKGVGLDENPLKIISLVGARVCGKKTDEIGSGIDMKKGITADVSNIGKRKQNNPKSISIS